MRRTRTKTFTGCWTCRSRRVKCDEAVPECQRCRQKGVACEGYGLRLNWIHYDPHDAADDQEDEQPETRAERRMLASFGSWGVSSLKRLPSEELEGTLSKLDEWRPGVADGIEDGAFAVFAVRSMDTPAFRGSHDVETTRHEDNNAFATPHQDVDDFHTDSVPAAQTLLDLGRHDHHAAPRHLDALSMPAKQKRLIHHWITFTSRKLVLIDEPHNPCRTMMLPMALKGLTSHASGSSADVAIFHAVCASAAYNLFELSGRSNEQDGVLALYHDNEAVHHLRHNLARAHEHRDQSFAMAIMACIAVEAVSGTTQRWRTHVSGGLAYLAQLQSQGLPEAALSAFRQHMVKMAILCGFPVAAHLKHFLDDETVDGLEFTFPYYGVSRSFLRAHDRINGLLARMPRERTASQEQEQELDAFELQLYLDFPRLEPLTMSGLGMSSPAHAVVIHHTSTAFYYAGLVFFQRSVRRAAVAAVQELVELGLQELESIDRVGQGALGCLMLWPVLVLGAECDGAALQKRMQAWFLAQRRLGFRNVVVLEDLVKTVWRGRREGRADAEWRVVIEQAQFDVFRL